MTRLAHLAAARQLTLDDLFAEAAALGAPRVWPDTVYNTSRVTGWEVTLTAYVRNTKMEIKAKHTSLHCALADAINEARQMGVGASE